MGSDRAEPASLGLAMEALGSPQAGPQQAGADDGDVALGLLSEIGEMCLEVKKETTADGTAGSGTVVEVVSCAVGSLAWNVVYISKYIIPVRFYSTLV